MMSDNRIEPAEVAAWFEAHPDVTPLPRRFFQLVRHDEVCDRLGGCCGLTSQVLRGKPPGPVIFTDTMRPRLGGLEGICLVLGLDYDYAAAFVDGWDGAPPPVVEADDEDEAEAMLAGYADGFASFAATMEAIR